jgi:3-oxoacyl-[acyl-carrier protein] reductase
MDLGLDNQVVFVAGSSRGIGKAIAATLLAEGASVVLTGRDQASLHAALTDLTHPSTQARVLAISGDFGTGSGKPGWDQPHEEWQRLFELNFFASTRLTQAVLPHLLSNPSGGSILYISSIVAIEATPAPLPYSAAKAALVNYSKNLARQLGPKKVRINTIAPGNIYFPGGSWERHLNNRRGAVEAMLQTEVPQQRFGTPEEIASLAAYLCSSQAAFATGGCYVMDGGQTRSL